MPLLRLHAPGAVDAPMRVLVGDDDLEIVPDGPARLVDGPGRPRRLVVVDVGAGPVAAVEPGPSTLVYADRFADADLDILRRRHGQGVDRAAQVVVSGRQLTVVVQRPGAPGRPAPRGLASLRATAGGDGGPAVRGPVTVRLAQHLLEQPGRMWSPTGLRDFDGATTVATASRFLAELRRLGLAAAEDGGRVRGHRVTDAQLLLDWVAERREGPSRGVHLGYLRARDLTQLATALGARIGSAGIAAAITGTAAAEVEGVPVTSAVPVVTVRVADIELASAAHRLGLATGERGANVRLVADVGRVGTLHRRVVEGLPLAGPVRVWLDLRAERRGAALAELYRDHVLAPLVEAAG